MKIYAVLEPNQSNKLDELKEEFNSIIGHSVETIQRKRDILVEYYRIANGRAI